MARTPGADRSNRDDATIDPTSSNDVTEGWDIGSRWTNTVSKSTWFCADNSTGAAVWKDVTSTVASPSFQMTLGGPLDAPTLPLSRAGIERASSGVTLTRFSARRGVPGSAGTTTIQLEVNGSPVAGAVLSWVPADAAFAEKTVVVAQPVALGDDVSIRLTAAETGAEDVYTEAS